MLRDKGDQLYFILPKNPPFILREPQDERRAMEIIGDFPFMLSLVEAFLGFSAESYFIYASVHDRERNLPRKIAR